MSSAASAPAPGESPSSPRRSSRRPLVGKKAAEGAPADAAAAQGGGSARAARSSMGPEGKLVLAFGSSGWLFVYYLGVVKALKAAGLHRNAYLIASSGGAIAGCTLFFDVDLDKMVEYVCDCAQTARTTLLGPFRLREYVAGAISRFANAQTTPARLHGNLEVSVTVLPTLRNHRITDFSSWEAMRTHLLATACIVPLAGLPMWVPGLGLVLDGGLSDLQLVRGWRRSGSFCRVHEGWGQADAVAVTACPFYMSRAAIRPDTYVPPLWAFYPPPPERLRELYAMGQRNAEAWLARRAAGGVDAAAGGVPPPVGTSWAHRAEEYASAAAAAARAAAAGAAEEAAALAAAAQHAASTVAHDAARLADAAAVAARRGSTRLGDARAAMLRALACLLVYCELCAQAGASAAAAALPAAYTGRSRARALARARSFLAPLPCLARMALSPPRERRARAALAAQTYAVLQQLSLLYRFLAPIMQL